MKKTFLIVLIFFLSNSFIQAASIQLSDIKDAMKCDNVDQLNKLFSLRLTRSIQQRIVGIAIENKSHDCMTKIITSWVFYWKEDEIQCFILRIMKEFPTFNNSDAIRAILNLRGIVWNQTEICRFAQQAVTCSLDVAFYSILAKYDLSLPFLRGLRLNIGLHCDCCKEARYCLSCDNIRRLLSEENINRKS